MRVNRNTAISLTVALAGIFGLAGWGHLLRLEAETLAAVRTAAAALAIVVLGAMRALLSTDVDKDGIPDIIQDGPRVPPAALVIALAVSLSAGMWAGCGPGAAQTALSAQASIVVATQPARFDAYAILDERCGAEHETREAYRACMMPARHVARASDSYRETLEGAQAVLNADSGADPVPCVIEAAKRFLAAAQAAQVPVPADVYAFASMIPAGECNAADQ